MKSGIGKVARRHVFFLSGFDPKGAAYYHSLYRGEALKQANVNAMGLQVTPRQRGPDGNSTWEVSAELLTGKRCHTTFEFVRWDDIVRRHWPRSIWRLLLDMVVAYTLMLRSGVIVSVWKVSRKTLAGLAFPLVILGGGLALSMGFGALLGMTLYTGGLSGGRGTGAVVAGAGGLLSLGLGLWFTRLLEARLNPTWLVNIFSFTGKQVRGLVPELELRLNAAAQKLAQKIRASDVDEILVVGFSVGSILAVSVVARALQAVIELDADIEARSAGTGLTGPPEVAAISRPVLSLLTLGHCIPMLGLLPQATAFRQELKLLAQAQDLRWIDFSSVTDWGSFALVDPVKVCNVLPAMSTQSAMAVNPLMRSPRFHTLFAPASYIRVRRNKRRMHLQYLMAAELPGEYDYFAITAGCMTLGARYADR